MRNDNITRLIILLLPSQIRMFNVHLKLKLSSSSIRLRSLDLTKNLIVKMFPFSSKFMRFMRTAYIRFSVRGEACNRMFMSFSFRTRVAARWVWLKAFSEKYWFRVNSLRRLSSIPVQRQPKMNLHFSKILCSFQTDDALVLHSMNDNNIRKLKTWISLADWKPFL